MLTREQYNPSTQTRSDPIDPIYYLPTTISQSTSQHIGEKEHNAGLGFFALLIHLCSAASRRTNHARVSHHLKSHHHRFLRAEQVRKPKREGSRAWSGTGMAPSTIQCPWSDLEARKCRENFQPISGHCSLINSLSCGFQR